MFGIENSFRVAAIAMIAASGMVAVPAWSEDPDAADPTVETIEPNSADVTADVLAARPVGLFATVMSGVTFVASLPFIALDPALDFEMSRETLLDYPIDDTFKRPLGDLRMDPVPDARYDSTTVAGEP